MIDTFDFERSEVKRIDIFSSTSIIGGVSQQTPHSFIYISRISFGSYIIYNLFDRSPFPFLLLHLTHTLRDLIHYFGI